MRIIFFNIFFLFLVLFEIQTEPKKNDIFMFGFTMENIKENQI